MIVGIEMWSLVLKHVTLGVQYSCVADHSNAKLSLSILACSITKLGV